MSCPPGAEVKILALRDGTSERCPAALLSLQVALRWRPCPTRQVRGAAGPPHRPSCVRLSRCRSAFVVVSSVMPRRQAI